MENLTYEEFIQNILNTRGRFGCGEEYHERHHIIPKCIGGGNEQENLIDLFAREHFIAHKLLALENPDNDSLVYAWGMMAFARNTEQKRYELMPEEYEEVRKVYSEAQKGENNPFYGKHHTDETRKKLSEYKFGEKNPMYGNHRFSGPNHPNYGKPMSDEQKKKISKANSGEKNPMYGKHPSEETRKKMSDAKKGENHPLFGKYHSDETCKKMSENHADFTGKNNPMACKIIQYDKQGNFIKIWNYINEAASELEIKEPSISMCCSGKYKTAGGFIWYYLYDQTRKDGTIIHGAITLGLITEEDALSMIEEQTSK